MVGGPGHIENTLKQIKLHVLTWFFISGALLIGAWWLTEQYLNLEPIVFLGDLIFLWVIITLVIGGLVARSVSAPLKALSEAILHISPTPLQVKSPDIEKLGLGKELVAGLVRQVYDMNTQASDDGAIPKENLPLSLGIKQLPIAVIAIDDADNITFANAKASELTGGNEEIVGKNLYSLFDILFQSEDTLQDWIQKAKANSITAQKIWHGVRISIFGNQIKYIDIAATYSKPTEKGSEVLLTLFDETEVYAEQDKSLSFIALAVHELRTPLTMLRGYIEVFEDEFKTDDPELKEYMRRTRAATEILTAFVTNILDVARVDQNQLALHLNKENWTSVLSNIVKDMMLRAEVQGKQIDLTIAENLPEVGVDRISIAEVMVNLIDNAIKYSPPDKKVIKVTSGLNKEGLIETTVQDFGVGIPTNVLPHIFEKYSRSHRSRASIGGTGLGLYLSKALVKAHGGNIWVRSHEGQGSVFGFSVLPFSQVADKTQNGNNGITRNAHGWIKNHTLSRR